MTVEQVFDQYYVCGKTDCGIKRDHNEDTILINQQAALIMVADGMGGHLYGDRASLEAINLIDKLVEKYLPVAELTKPRMSVWEKLMRFFGRNINADASLEFQAQVITDILIEANNVLFQHNQAEQFPEGSGMGTTIVGCRFFENKSKMLVFHVGDSRLYRIRNKALSRVTKDHSAYQFWLDTGQIGIQPNTNIILQGIGPSAVIKPEVQIVDVLPDDGFLLCSDGLSDMLEDQQLEDILCDLSVGNIEEKVNILIDGANNLGGKDNISAILICQ